jgi:hypothetical protein
MENFGRDTSSTHTVERSRKTMRDIVEDRPVVRFLAPAITDYIRKTQDKSIDGEGSHGLLPELEAQDREWSQDGR